MSWNAVFAALIWGAGVVAACEIICRYRNSKHLWWVAVGAIAGLMFLDDGLEAVFGL